MTHRTLTRTLNLHIFSECPYSQVHFMRLYPKINVVTMSVPEVCLTEVTSSYEELFISRQQLVQTYVAPICPCEPAKKKYLSHEHYLYCPFLYTL